LPSEKCSECKGLKELRKKSYACYLSVKKHGWDTEFFEVKQKPMGYWNDKEHCMEEAKKYRTVRELQLASDGCYASLKRNGWLLEAYPPKNGLKPINYWNREGECDEGCQAMQYQDGVQNKVWRGIYVCRKERMDA
jgi:hypothetical protein